MFLFTILNNVLGVTQNEFSHPGGKEKFVLPTSRSFNIDTTCDAKRQSASIMGTV